jgi:hypothetical protein
MPDDKIHILPDAHPAGFIFEAVSLGSVLISRHRKAMLLS